MGQNDVYDFSENVLTVLEKLKSRKNNIAIDVSLVKISNLVDLKTV